MLFGKEDWTKHSPELGMPDDLHHSSPVLFVF
jgi:hypothetical protein